MPKQYLRHQAQLDKAMILLKALRNLGNNKKGMAIE